MTIREINRTISTANYATLWIKELDFTGCIMDCEVHCK